MDCIDLTDLIDIIRAAILLLALAVGAAYTLRKIWGLVRGTLPLLLVLSCVAGGIWAANADQNLSADTDRPGQRSDPRATGGAGRFGFACKSPGPRRGVKPAWRRGIRECSV